MARLDLTFRVFVSSTFSDLIAERNALQEDVFPQLRAYCRKHGARFQAIDLRWGVSEEAALDQQTMNICLEELRRCQRTSPRPNFIVLLGQRYGWCPLPAQIEVVEFASLLDVLPETDRQRLGRWYRRDDNAVPPHYCLQPRHGQFTESALWMEEEQQLRGILSQGIKRLGWPAGDKRRIKYEAAATHQEIIHGALQVDDSVDHVLCFFRTIKGLPEDGSTRGFVDLTSDGTIDHAARRRLEDVKGELRRRFPGNIHEYSAGWTGTGAGTDHLKQFCQDVFDRLRRAIDQELEGGAKTETDGIPQQFIGREDLLRQIEDYAEGRDTLGGARLSAPLVVFGRSGSGKSSLLARAAADLRRLASRHLIVVRAIGQATGDSDLSLLLRDLCGAIDRGYNNDHGLFPDELPEQVRRVGECLGLADAERPLLLVVDALDQLSYDEALAPQQYLDWLPAELPPHVRIVVSCMEDESQDDDPATLGSRALKLLRARSGPADNFLNVGAMSRAEGIALLTGWLQAVHRTLQPQQQKYVLDMFDAPGNGLPLYIRLAFETVKHWKSWTPSEIAADCRGILEHTLDRIEKEHGRVLVSRALGYLKVARRKLGEDDFLELLSLDSDVLAEVISRSPNERIKRDSDRLKALPAILWVRLYAALGHYLKEEYQLYGGGAKIALQFVHGQQYGVVKRRYFDPEKELDLRCRLANCFAQGLVLLSDPVRFEEVEGTTSATPNVVEVLYQLFYLNCACLWPGAHWGASDQASENYLRWIAVVDKEFRTAAVALENQLRLAANPAGLKSESRRRCDTFVKDLLSTGPERLYEQWKGFLASLLFGGYYESHSHSALKAEFEVGNVLALFLHAAERICAMCEDEEHPERRVFIENAGRRLRETLMSIRDLIMSPEWMMMERRSGPRPRRFQGSAADLCQKFDAEFRSTDQQREQRRRERLAPIHLDEHIPRSIVECRLHWSNERPHLGDCIQIDTELAQLSPVKITETDLHHIMKAPLNNAADAMPNGGRIRVRTKWEEPWIVLEIEDSGQGMTEEELRRFSETGVLGSGQYAWLESGMMINTISRSGGDVELSSVAGKGTTVRVLLPPYAAPAVPRRRSRRPSASLLSSMLVGKDADTLDLLALELRPRSALVRRADDASLALAMLEEQRCDLVVVDSNIGNMTCEQFVAAARQQSPSTAIVLLKRFSWPDRDVPDLAYDVDMILKKPVRLAAFSDALDCIWS